MVYELAALLVLCYPRPILRGPTFDYPASRCAVLARRYLGMSAAISFSGLAATKILAHGHQKSGLVATRTTGSRPSDLPIDPVGAPSRA